MEYTGMSFLVGVIVILLWYCFVHKRCEVPKAKQFGLLNKSQVINSADKSAKQKAKRDRRKRKQSRICKSNGSQAQDLTPDLDCPINAGQTEDDGGNLSPPFDTCEIDRDASCLSKLAKEPLVAAAGLPNVTQKANDADKSAKRQVKRDRRKRKRLQITKPSGIPEQDSTPDVGAPINTGQTEDDGGNLSPPFDTCEIDRDTSSSSKLAKEPLVAAAGLPNVTQKANGADKSAKRQVKRDQRKRKKLQVAKLSGIPEQDLTPNVDAPINAGQTEDDGGNLSPPFDTCEIDRDASCSSKLAKEPLVPLINKETNVTDLPSSAEEAGDVGEQPSSLLSDGCMKGRDIPTATKSNASVVSVENDGRTTILRYIARSEIPRIAGRGGRITQLLEKKHGVKIDLPQGDSGNIVISGGNETTRLAVEACIRDRLIMTITLPKADTHTRVAMKKLVDLGKLKILNESNQGSVTFTGLTRDCKVILNVPKCH